MAARAVRLQSSRVPLIQDNLLPESDHLWRQKFLKTIRTDEIATTRINVTKNFRLTVFKYWTISIKKQELKGHSIEASRPHSTSICLIGVLKLKKIFACEIKHCVKLDSFVESFSGTRGGTSLGSGSKPRLKSPSLIFGSQ